MTGKSHRPAGASKRQNRITRESDLASSVAKMSVKGETPEAVPPDQCKVMISFNDKSAGADAEALCNFLVSRGVATFCTRVFCPDNAGDWRELTQEGACVCKIYVTLMTKGWQESPECQAETKIIKNRIAGKGKAVTLIPVWYDCFDKTLDITLKHHYDVIWANYQAVQRTSETWKEDVYRLFRKFL